MNRHTDQISTEAVVLSAYRQDIDGLRAIAVLAVVLFHIDPNWTPGGFVGVDIFFVISGFLITGNIVRDRAAGTFTFAEFYRRRILRILPALTVVIVATLLIGQLVMLPKDFVALAASAAAAQASVANVYFTYYLDTGYFADAAILHPLLHLWSLGVEEQFYLFWPMLLIAGGRIPGRAFWSLTVVGIALSFAAGEIMLASDPSFAYYMLPSRAGQLLAGAFLAYLLSRGFRLRPAAAAMVSLLGLGLLAYSISLLGDHQPYPGLNAIPPTLGAALVILGGATPSPVGGALSIEPMTFIGRISYSLYLWHWPVLSFWWYAFGPPGTIEKLLLGGVMFGLAAITYAAVERPCRRLPHGFWKSAVLFLATPAYGAALVVIGSLATAGFGVYVLFPSYAEQLKAIADGARPAFRAAYVCQGFAIAEELMDKPECIINSTSEPDVLLWGDSNAAHYVGALREAAEEFGFSFRNIAHAGCPPVLFQPEQFTRADRKKECADSVAIVSTRLGTYRTILLSAAWQGYLHKLGFDEALKGTITKLRGDGHDVFVMGRIPPVPGFDRDCEAKAVKLPFIGCDARAQAPSDEVDRMNNLLRQITIEAGGTYLDLNAAVCSNGTCRGTMNGKGLYYDDIHWSIDGSIRVGQHARRSGLFPPELRQIQ